MRPTPTSRLATANRTDLPPLVTLFQPIVRLPEGSVFGYEALTRSPSLATDSADPLLAWAEAHGRIADLDVACIRLALERFAAGVAQAGRHAEQLQLFLNLHPSSLPLPALHDLLADEGLRRAGLDPEHVVLELVGLLSLDAMGPIEAGLTRYRRAGLGIALDDLGSGHAALASLLTLEPNFVKVDRTLVEGIDRDRVRQSLMQGLVDAARHASIRVVAEGIETPEELAALIRIGVDLGQGFLLGEPAPSLAAPRREVHLRPPADRRGPGTGVGAELQASAGDIVESVEPIAPSAPVREAVARFEASPTLLGLPVVQDGVPTGLIMRDRLFYTLGRRFGHAVFSDRPVHWVAEPAPLVVDEETPLPELARQVAGRPSRSVYDSILVTGGGRYRGVVTVQRLLERMTDLQIQAARDASPLTGLPGNRMIRAELTRRLSAGEAFSALYCDIDEFKAFNDLYGFERGDQAIRLLARVIETQVAGREGAFAGHVGGDDFVAVVPGDAGRAVAEEVVRVFTREGRMLYDEADRVRGYIEGVDRQGRPARFALMSLSVVILRNRAGARPSYLEFVSNLGRLKREAKLRPGNAVVQ